MQRQKHIYLYWLENPTHEDQVVARTEHLNAIKFRCERLFETLDTNDEGVLSGEDLKHVGRYALNMLSSHGEFLTDLKVESFVSDLLEFAKSSHDNAVDMKEFFSWFDAKNRQFEDLRRHLDFGSKEYKKTFRTRRSSTAETGGGVEEYYSISEGPNNFAIASLSDKRDSLILEMKKVFVEMGKLFNDDFTSHTGVLEEDELFHITSMAWNKVSVEDIHKLNARQPLFLNAKEREKSHRDLHERVQKNLDRVLSYTEWSSWFMSEFDCIKEMTKNTLLTMDSIKYNKPSGDNAMKTPALTPRLDQPVTAKKKQERTKRDESKNSHIAMLKKNESNSSLNSNSGNVIQNSLLILSMTTEQKLRLVSEGENGIRLVLSPLLAKKTSIESALAGLQIILSLCGAGSVLAHALVNNKAVQAIMQVLLTHGQGSESEEIKLNVSACMNELALGTSSTLFHENENSATTKGWDESRKFAVNNIHNHLFTVQLLEILLTMTKRVSREWNDKSQDYHQSPCISMAIDFSFEAKKKFPETNEKIHTLSNAVLGISGDGSEEGLRNMIHQLKTQKEDTQTQLKLLKTLTALCVRGQDGASVDGETGCGMNGGDINEHHMTYAEAVKPHEKKEENKRTSSVLLVTFDNFRLALRKTKTARRAVKLDMPEMIITALQTHSKANDVLETAWAAFAALATHGGEDACRILHAKGALKVIETSLQSYEENKKESKRKLQIVAMAATRRLFSESYKVDHLGNPGSPLDVAKLIYKLFVSAVSNSKEEKENIKPFLISCCTTLFVLASYDRVKEFLVTNSTKTGTIKQDKKKEKRVEEKKGTNNENAAPLVYILKTFPKSCAFQCSVVALAFACGANNATVRDQLKDSETLDGILTAMKNHVEDSGVQQWGCAALHLIEEAFLDCEEDRMANPKTLQREVQTIFQAMTSHATNATVTIKALSALSTICGKGQARLDRLIFVASAGENSDEQISDFKGITTVLNAMKDFKNDSKVQEWGALLLANVATNHRCCSFLRKQKAAELMLAATKRHGRKNKDLVEYVMRMLMSLGCTESSAFVPTNYTSHRMAVMDQQEKQIREKRKINRFLAERRQQALGVSRRTRTQRRQDTAAFFNRLAKNTKSFLEVKNNTKKIAKVNPENYSLATSLMAKGTLR
eukprot:g2643.t1